MAQLTFDASNNLNVAIQAGGGSSTNISQWGSVAVAGAANIAGDGTQAGPTTRPILRKYTQVLTTANLGISGVFTSAWFDTNQTGDMFVQAQAFSDKVSGTNGFTIQTSDDTSNTNTQITAASGSVAISTLFTLSLLVRTRYWRVVYTNSITATTSFEITATASGTFPPQIFGPSSIQNGIPSSLVINSSGAAGVAFTTGTAGEGLTAAPEQSAAGTAFVPYVLALNTTGGGANPTSTVFVRQPNFFKTASATASGNTALWTPTAGKKFRLMRFMVQITGNATTAAGAVVTVSFQDAAAAMNIATDSFIPTAALTAADDFVSPWVDLGNGFLSAAANNILNINLSSALTAGNVRVTCCGTEE